jgi:hypothetical protein
MRSRPPLASGLAALVACATVLGLPACTGEKSFTLPGIDAGPPSARYQAVCAGWAQRECTAAAGCALAILARWEDTAQCVARETLSCELQAADPDVSFDSARVAGCTFPDGCAGAPGMLSAPDSAGLCLSAGKAPLGAPCIWNSACASGECTYSYGFDGTKAVCGTCQAPVRCACTPNQECLVRDGGFECATLPDAGDPCGAPLFSCNDAQCVAFGDAGEGLCTPLPTVTVGMPCDTGGPLCISSGSELYCDATSHCRAYTPADYGAPCTASTGGEGGLCIGAGWCDSMATGVCQPPSADGDPCDDLLVPCLAPARCVSGSCVFPSLASCAAAAATAAAR